MKDLCETFMFEALRTQLKTLHFEDLVSCTTLKLHNAWFVNCWWSTWKWPFDVLDCSLESIECYDDNCNIVETSSV